MRYTYYYITGAVLVMLFASCKSGDELTPPAPLPPTPIGGEDNAMYFLTNAGDRVTRASKEETGSLLHDLGYRNFGIWAWRTADGSDWRSVMDSYHVSYDAKYVGQGRGEFGWGYDQEAGYEHQVLKYWNLSYKKYQFQGYAPWVGTAASANPYTEMNGERVLVFHNISGHVPAKESVTEYSEANKDKVDWLYTYTERSTTGIASPALTIDRDLTVYDKANPADAEKWLYIGTTDATPTKTVPLRYHHLLPKVVFQLKVYDGTNEELEIYQRINVSVKAHDDTLDDNKDTKLYTKAEELYYSPVNYSATTDPVGDTYIKDGSKSVKGFSEFVQNDVIVTYPTTATFVSFKKSDGTQTRDISPFDTDGEGNIIKEGWLELPQTTPVFDVKLEFGGTLYARTLDPSINPSLPQVWEPDHIYVYQIKFNVSAPILEVTSYTEDWNSEEGEFDINDW